MKKGGPIIFVFIEFLCGNLHFEFLALADGFQNGLTAESSDDPNDVTYVDESSLSGFGDYEYDDYSDYTGGFHTP